MLAVNKWQVLNYGDLLVRLAGLHAPALNPRLVQVILWRFFAVLIDHHFGEGAINHAESHFKRVDDSVELLLRTAERNRLLA